MEFFDKSPAVVSEKGIVIHVDVPGCIPEDDKVFVHINEAYVGIEATFVELVDGVGKYQLALDIDGSIKFTSRVKRRTVPGAHSAAFAVAYQTTTTFVIPTIDNAVVEATGVVVSSGETVDDPTLTFNITASVKPGDLVEMYDGEYQETYLIGYAQPTVDPTKFTFRMRLSDENLHTTTVFVKLNRNGVRSDKAGNFEVVYDRKPQFVDSFSAEDNTPLADHLADTGQSWIVNPGDVTELAFPSIQNGKLVTNTPLKLIVPNEQLNPGYAYYIELSMQMEAFSKLSLYRCPNGVTPGDMASATWLADVVGPDEGSNIQINTDFNIGYDTQDPTGPITLRFLFDGWRLEVMRGNEVLISDSGGPMYRSLPGGYIGIAIEDSIRDLRIDNVKIAYTY